MNHKPFSVCIVNRNYPPMSGATGYHAHQLALYLRSVDIDVHIVSTATNSRQETDKVHYVNRFYDGSAKKLRLLSSYVEASRLITKAISLNCGFYIVMTDPPLLNYIAARKMKGRQWLLWTMDLFPDGFVANGLVSRNNRFYKLYQKQLRKSPPQLMITLGERQTSFLQQNNFPGVPSIEWPIGFRTQKELTEDITSINPPSWVAGDKIVIAYIGNLGEAHDPEVLKWIAEAIDPDHHNLVLACQGTHKKKTKEALGNLEHVHLETRIPETFMPRIDIHIVILRSEWTHICVPSKAISAIQYGGAVLFFGSTESDTWQYVKAGGWQVSTKAEIALWAKSITTDTIKHRKNEASALHKELESQKQQGWKALGNYLKENSPS